jgi:hypothetical protein
LTSRDAARLAYSLFSVTLLLAFVTAAMQVATLSADLPQDYGSRAADMDLVTMVRNTMHPEHVSLWLHPGAEL